MRSSTARLQETENGTTAEASSATCPACGSPITQEKFEKILRISEVREKELDEERAEAERERLRAVEEQNARVVEGLREQLKTLEERRHRDELALKETIGELQRKAEDKDRRHFGPEGEEELIRVLREQFPGDRIEHRGKGGDVLHVIIDGGHSAGVVVYEVKRTAGWQLAYLRQTKAAMEMHGTPYGVLVTRSLPAKASGMCVLGGVIVTEPAIATQVVAVLREGIVAIARLRLSEEGKAGKSAALFDYMRSQEFTTAIRRVQEKIAELRNGLAREKSLHDGWWRAREQHYGGILREAGGIDARVRELLDGDDDEAPQTDADVSDSAGGEGS
jgi:hypothetical protein